MKLKLAITLLLISTISFASTKGEVKILYSCEALDLIPHENEIKGTVTFLETSDSTLYKNGLILRKRIDSKDSDITIKMRWPKGKPIINHEIEAELAQSVNGKLKCELDVGYDPISPLGVESCSFKSEGLELYLEHTNFLKMVNSKITEIPNELNEINIESITWKIPVSGFDKKTELQLWRKNGQCLLEASTKFENGKALEALKALKNAIKAKPLAKQISKTGWALGLFK